jgi:hypothetical protein
LSVHTTNTQLASPTPLSPQPRTPPTNALPRRKHRVHTHGHTARHLPWERSLCQQPPCRVPSHQRARGLQHQWACGTRECRPTQDRQCEVTRRHLGIALPTAEIRLVVLRCGYHPAGHPRPPRDPRQVCSPRGCSCARRLDGRRGWVVDAPASENVLGVASWRTKVG